MREYKEKECVNCGETKKIAAKGLCRRCYSRLQRNGHFEKIKIKNVCEVEGCNKYVVTHGLCDMHRQRLARHGHIEQTRPNDWGDRKKHPLYVLWVGHRRYKTKHPLCKEWHERFWEFANEINDRPSKEYHLRPIDPNHPIGPDNWHWVVNATTGMNSEDQKAYLRQWAREDRKRNPDKYKDISLKRQYGISLDDFNKMSEEQQGKCAICRKKETALDPRTKQPRELAVDHCHNKGHIRGLLCSKCNIGLGAFKDSTELLQTAIDYLNTEA